jgi:hypothetical protein
MTPARGAEITRCCPLGMPTVAGKRRQQPRRRSRGLAWQYPAPRLRRTHGDEIRGQCGGRSTPDESRAVRRAVMRRPAGMMGVGEICCAILKGSS